MSKIELTIPTSWDDITLGQYIQLRPVLNTDMNDVKRIINVLAVLTNEKTDLIKEITIPNYHVILKKISFLNDPLPTELEKNLFKIGGQLYKFKLNSNKLLFGEYINLMEIMQKASDNEEIIYENLHKIFTIICRPVKKTILGIKEIKVTSEDVRNNADNFFNNMSISIAYPIAVFFCNHYPDLIKVIKTSLIQMAQKNKKTAEMMLKKEGLMSHGVGSA
jgi:hypothetical protein